MDTVQTGSLERWDVDPFVGKVSQKKVYGRGASDMKSGLVAMFLALLQMSDEIEHTNKKIVLALTSGEEVDCIGAKQLLKSIDWSGVKSIVIGEPTDNQIGIGHKGALWAKVKTFGKAAHGAIAESGVNAIDLMNKTLPHVYKWLEEHKCSHESLGSSTYSLNQIIGGNQPNVVPDYCEAIIDIRTVPPQNHEEIIHRLKNQIEKSSDIQIELLLDRPSVFYF
ncbi:M20/M25/M40 family metallo-hydrolase [Thalassobacillus sp. C254]|uniref:M20/M25/M40 family metallo-hydrolase n=1 Tax=Thalassobacillus sp. C254 TaxID=1225341 RepID=UPI0006CFB46F|nr:M20/M25/M40 family metallo-hydrolase [Thalassobacillus sp. C254]